MQPPSDTDSPFVVQLISTPIQFGIVGFVGSIPLALLTALMYGAQIGGDVWLLGALLIGSYFPLRSIWGSILHKSGSVNYIPKHFNIPLLILSALAFLFMIPVLWAATFTALVIGLFTYAFLEQSLLLALVTSLAYQIFNVYRQVKYSPESDMNTFVVNFQDLSQRFGTDTIVINPEDVRHDNADIVYHLPEQTSDWQSSAYDDEEIIILDPEDSQHDEQQD